MNINEYLFPNRLTRRDFIKWSGAAAAGLTVSGVSQAAETKSPTRIGSGPNTYELVEDWGQLPAGMKYGFGCGVVVHSRSRRLRSTGQTPRNLEHRLRRPCRLYTRASEGHCPLHLLEQRRPRG